MLSSNLLLGVLSDTFSQESLSQEETSVEIERVYYAKLLDFDQLERAATQVHQEQFEYRMYRDNKAIGTIRSRSYDHGDAYELTIKRYIENQMGAMETNLSSTKDVHDVIAALSDRVMRKRRYVFPAPVVEGSDVELKWEVDVFLLEDGSVDPWVKIDLEVPSSDADVPALPIQVFEIIDASYGNTLTSEQRKTIDDLFSRVTIKTQP